MRLNKVIFLTIFGLAISTFFLGCSNLDKEIELSELTEVTVVLDWVPNTNHTGLYVAKDLGYFEDEGLNVKIIQPFEGGGADVIAAGKAEFGISYQEQVTYARTTDNPLPIKAISAIIQNNTSGFASPKEKNIITPKDFENKVYGGWGSPVEEAILKALMEKEGADFSKLDMVDIGEADFFTSVKSYVDFSWIYYGWDGVAGEINDFPIHFIRLNEIDERLNYYTPVIIANENYINENEDIVKRFLKATEKGYLFSIDSPEVAVESLLRFAPEIDARLALESQKYLANEYIADSEHWGVMEENVWENYSNWMYENDLLNTKLEVNGAFTNEYLPKTKR